jgi:hypothetical protein
MHCLRACSADDALLRASVALRLVNVWEEAEQGSLAVQAAEQGIGDLTDARANYVQGREVGYTLSTSSVDGEDELYQRLSCIHMELLTRKFHIQLMLGLVKAQGKTDAAHEQTLAALKKRQGLQASHAGKSFSCAPVYSISDSAYRTHMGGVKLTLLPVATAGAVRHAHREAGPGGEPRAGPAAVAPLVLREDGEAAPGPSSMD